MDSLTIVDLFCGIGGFSQGAESLGLQVDHGFDIDTKSLETWSSNFSGTAHNTNLVTEDISTIDSRTPDNVDCVLASPPCNDISVVNRTNTTSNIQPIKQTGRLIVALEPAFFIFENVPNIKWNYQDHLDYLTDCLRSDYTLNTRLLNTAWYGVSQHRVRFILIGVRTDVLDDPPLQFPKPTHGQYGSEELVNLKDAFSDINEPTDKTHLKPKEDNYELLKQIPPSLNYSFFTAKRGHPNPQFEWREKFSDFLRKADPDSPAMTITSECGGGNEPYHWNNRKFSEAELKQIQGFPQHFQIPFGYAETRRQIGKSIPPLFATQLILSTYIQTELYPNYINTDKELHPISCKRTNPSKLQKRAEERYKELDFE
jgi:DNA (cytosine-5)-methyltransferase 1